MSLSSVTDNNSKSPPKTPLLEIEEDIKATGTTGLATNTNNTTDPPPIVYAVKSRPVVVTPTPPPLEEESQEMSNNKSLSGQKRSSGEGGLNHQGITVRKNHSSSTATNKEMSDQEIDMKILTSALFLSGERKSPSGMTAQFPNVGVVDDGTTEDENPRDDEDKSKISENDNNGTSPSSMTATLAGSNSKKRKVTRRRNTDGEKKAYNRRRPASASTAARRKERSASISTHAAAGVDSERDRNAAKSPGEKNETVVTAAAAGSNGERNSSVISMEPMDLLLECPMADNCGVCVLSQGELDLHLSENPDHVVCTYFCNLCRIRCQDLAAVAVHHEQYHPTEPFCHTCRFCKPKPDLPKLDMKAEDGTEAGTLKGNTGKEVISSCVESTNRSPKITGRQSKGSQPPLATATDQIGHQSGGHSLPIKKRGHRQSHSRPGASDLDGRGQGQAESVTVASEKSGTGDKKVNPLIIVSGEIKPTTTVAAVLPPGLSGEIIPGTPRKRNRPKWMEDGSCQIEVNLPQSSSPKAPVSTLKQEIGERKAKQQRKERTILNQDLRAGAGTGLEELTQQQRQLNKTSLPLKPTPGISQPIPKSEIGSKMKQEAGEKELLIGRSTQDTMFRDFFEGKHTAENGIQSKNSDFTQVIPGSSQPRTMKNEDVSTQGTSSLSSINNGGLPPQGTSSPSEVYTKSFPRTPGKSESSFKRTVISPRSGPAGGNAKFPKYMSGGWIKNHPGTVPGKKPSNLGRVRRTKRSPKSEPQIEAKIEPEPNAEIVSKALTNLNQAKNVREKPSSEEHNPRVHLQNFTNEEQGTQERDTLPPALNSHQYETTEVKTRRNFMPDLAASSSQTPPPVTTATVMAETRNNTKTRTRGKTTVNNEASPPATTRSTRNKKTRPALPTENEIDSLNKKPQTSGVALNGSVKDIKTLGQTLLPPHSPHKSPEKNATNAFSLTEKKIISAHTSPASNGNPNPDTDESTINTRKRKAVVNETGTLETNQLLPPHTSVAQKKQRGPSTETTSTTENAAGTERETSSGVSTGSNDRGSMNGNKEELGLDGMPNLKQESRNGEKKEDIEVDDENEREEVLDDAEWETISDSEPDYKNVQLPVPTRRMRCKARFIKNNLIRFLCNKVSNRNLLRISDELTVVKTNGNYIDLTMAAPMAAGFLHDLFCYTYPEPENANSNEASAAASANPPQPPPEAQS